MKRHIAFALILFFCTINPTLAMDWKVLHERSDALTFKNAQVQVEKSPSSKEALYCLGLVCLNLHKDAQARDNFNKILAINPESIEAKWGIAEVMRRQHKTAESQKMLEEIIKQDPNFSPALNSLAFIKYRQLQLDQAVRLALRVIEQGRQGSDTSNYVRALLIYGGTKGMIAHYGGPFSKIVNGTAALPNIKKAQSIQPDAAGVYFGLGSFYFLAPAIVGGDIDLAKEYLEKAIAKEPLFADSYVRLAQVYKQKGDKAKFKEYLNKALEIDPGNELALDVKSGACKFICAGNQE
ncbi:MAG: TRAP transporter TatT component family protein [Candidatus Omnitrophica bacterium]|nr:TRAP transporter TatT component family protein [Candidatus Omnitrophota bacterium]